MTSPRIKAAVSNILALRSDPLPLPDSSFPLEAEMQQYLPRHNDPAFIAQSADDTIRRHITVSASQLRADIAALKEKAAQGISEIQEGTEDVTRVAEEVIRLAEDTIAEAAAQVRAQMDRITSKVENLKTETATKIAVLKAE